MLYCVLAILLAMTASRSPAVQAPSDSTPSPSVSISLPQGIPSETVQIAYHMYGPFGGYGGYARQEAGQRSYTIAASVEGRAANEIRMIVYAPGCDFQTFVLPLAEDSRIKQEFKCQPARSVTLSGQIVPSELARHQNAELQIIYTAYWAHEFFSIADGAVAEFRLATVSPAEDGRFQVDLPYFRVNATGSASELRASVRLNLRDSKTWNPICPDLQPVVASFRSEDHNLRIELFYPDGLEFAPAHE